MELVHDTRVIAEAMIQTGCIGHTDLRNAGKRLMNKHHLMKHVIELFKKQAEITSPEEALQFAILGQLIADLASSRTNIRNDAIRYFMDGRSNELCAKSGLNPHYINEAMVTLGFLPELPTNESLSYWVNL